MRSAIVAALLMLAVLLVGARLVGAFGQLGAVVPGTPEAPAALPPTAEPRSLGEAPLEPATDSVRAEDEVWPEPATVNGVEPDRNFEQLLIAEPDFQRAAAELLNDPDPEVRRQGAEMLREFGVAQ